MYMYSGITINKQGNWYYCSVDCLIPVPPLSSQLTISPSSDLRVGTSVNVTCETDSSNPAVDIRWQPEMGSAVQYTEPGEFNGSMSTSIISSILEEDQFGINVYCKVFLGDKEQFNLQKQHAIPSKGFKCMDTVISYMLVLLTFIV